MKKQLVRVTLYSIIVFLMIYVPIIIGPLIPLPPEVSGNNAGTWILYTSLTVGIGIAAFRAAGNE